MKTHLKITLSAAKRVAFLVIVSFMLLVLVTTLQAQSEPFSPINTNEKTSWGKTKISVYPNPVRENLTVEISNTQHDWHIVKIYRSSGKEIETMKVNATQDENKIVLPMQDCSPGVYFVSVINQSGIKNYRVQKD